MDKGAAQLPLTKMHVYLLCASIIAVLLAIYYSHRMYLQSELEREAQAAEFERQQDLAEFRNENPLTAMLFQTAGTIMGNENEVEDLMQKEARASAARKQEQAEWVEKNPFTAYALSAVAYAQAEYEKHKK